MCWISSISSLWIITRYVVENNTIWHCQAARIWTTANECLAELQHHVRVRDRNGQDQAQQRHRPATSQPAQDGKGCTKGDRSGFDSQCIQAPSSAHDRAGLQETHEQDRQLLNFAFERLYVLSGHFVQFQHDGIIWKPSHNHGYRLTRLFRGRIPK
jgi:hypothetical protein